MKNLIQCKCRAFLAKPFFHDKRTLLWLWTLLPIIATVFKLHRNNNYLIFRGVFWHTVNQTSLYGAYPNEYFDVNHYGPLFALVVAPFAVMPVWLGMLFWNVALSLCLYVAISRSQLKYKQQIFIYWFCAETLLTSLFMQQFNIAIAAIIIASYFLIERERDFWAAFLIVLGTFVKLYGVVGLAFFFFSKHKGRFVLSLLLWAVVLFVAPMLISNADYVIGQYHEWYVTLLEKNGENLQSIAQNISLLGMVRRITGNLLYSDLWLIAPALVLFFIPYFRFSQYRNAMFRQTYLASVLLFVVLFSTGSESSSYIIAISGACIWYLSAPWQRNRWDVVFMVLVLMISGFGSSDLYPRCIRHDLIQVYSLKALPCTLVWLKLCYEMMFKNYASADVGTQSEASRS
ncbi:glycosyltransferase family 87 protein [Hoylesella timonensis]|uniref:glycosyltransferase family 87 protein n=1 Tax=Hoylesella timonensis TaxID=386414 RepID=UPI00242A5387|nr:glycosyltransferase family 87 protein [Hoylesella timonensis]